MADDKDWRVVDLGEKHFAETNHRYAIECDAGTGLVAKIEGMGERREQRANLIAAAPELLAALKVFADLCPGGFAGVGGGTLVAPSIKVQWIRDARAAVAKATGVQHPDSDETFHRV